MYYNSAADSALGSYRAVLQTVYRVQDLLGQRSAVPRAACFEPAWLHPAARDASCHRKHRHQCCDAVQEGRLLRSGRGFYHRPRPTGSYLQHDSGLWSVSVPRRAAGRLLLRPAED